MPSRPAHPTIMFNWFKKTLIVPETPGPAKAALLDEYTVHKKRGNEFLAQGMLQEAAKCYRRAVAINANYAEGFLNLGFVLKELHQYEEAERALKQAILLNPGVEDAYYLLATVLQNVGKLSEAVDNYNKALEIKPNFEIVYRDLSLALFQNGQIDRAEMTLLKAIGLYPLNADFHYYLGKLYASKDETDKAIDCYLKTLSIQPEFAEGHHDMGLALHAQNKLDAAIQSYQKALSCQSDYAEAHNSMAIALHGQGKLEAAIAGYRNAIAIDPRYAIAHNNLASVLQKQGKLEEAIEHLQQAITINPDYAQAHRNLGVALTTQGKLDAAVEYCQKALSIDPDYAEAYGSLADAFQALGKLEAATENYHRALALMPENAELHCNLGNSYTAQGKFDAAVEQFQQALTLRPDFTDAHLNLGLALVKQGLHDSAVRYFNNALSINPDCADAHLNIGLSQLTTGNFEQGWAEFEWRWKVAHMQSVKYDYSQPLWLGKEPLLGKTILLHFEQGFGDTIQFCRYAKLAAAQGATVLLLVPAALKSLLVGLEGVSQVLVEDEPLPAFDYHCPLMSLPLAFSTRVDTIPATSTYIACDQGQVTRWQGKLGSKNRPRIGLVWAGNRAHQNDLNRSIPPAVLRTLVTDRAQWVSLQKEIRPADQILLGNNVDSFGADLEDFSDTAGLIANMDLVISVDTAVAHLAGAMGKPVWVLLPFSPDWRWMLERSDCPWYPSARLFRQTTMGDWNSVLSSVATELRIRYQL